MSPRNILVPLIAFPAKIFSSSFPFQVALFILNFVINSTAVGLRICVVAVTCTFGKHLLRMLPNTAVGGTSPAEGSSANTGGSLALHDLTPTIKPLRFTHKTFINGECLFILSVGVPTDRNISVGRIVCTSFFPDLLCLMQVYNQLHSRWAAYLRPRCHLHLW